MPGEGTSPKKTRAARAAGMFKEGGPGARGAKSVRAAIEVAPGRGDGRDGRRSTVGAGDLSGLVADAPVGFLVVQGAQVVFANPEQRSLLGNIPVPFDVETLDPLVHRDDREAFRRLFHDEDGSRQPRRTASLRFRIQGCAAGPDAFARLECRAAPVRYGDGDALLVNMIGTDRPRESERPGVFAETTDMERLATAIAHEIRNPLSGINLDITSLEKVVAEAEAFDEDARRAARRIVGTLRGNSDRIEAVVRGILGISRHRAPQFVRCDTNRCAEAAATSSSMSVLRLEAGFRMRLAEGLPAVCADPRLLEEAILNLLTNAAEAVARSGRPRRIELASSEQDGFVVIRVADSGPGVPESDREKIFSPFFTTRRGAAGIGLTFSRRVVVEHGGTLTVGTSDLGGAEFRIELPVARSRAGGGRGKA